MRFENQTIDGVVTLDYNEFIRCTFKNATLLFHGGSFSFVECKFENVKVGAAEAANRTLAFLRFVHALNPQMVDELLKQGPQFKTGQKVTIN